MSSSVGMMKFPMEKQKSCSQPPTSCYMVLSMFIQLKDVRWDRCVNLTVGPLALKNVHDRPGFTHVLWVFSVHPWYIHFTSMLIHGASILIHVHPCSSLFPFHSESRCLTFIHVLRSQIGTKRKHTRNSLLGTLGTPDTTQAAHLRTGRSTQFFS